MTWTLLMASDIFGATDCASAQRATDNIFDERTSESPARNIKGISCWSAGADLSVTLMPEVVGVTLGGICPKVMIVRRRTISPSSIDCWSQMLTTSVTFGPSLPFTAIRTVAESSRCGGLWFAFDYLRN
jgi:hypothetical protein